MAFFQRLNRALRAFREPPEAPTPESALLSAPGATTPPAAFRPDPTYHPSLMHIYAAWDASELGNGDPAGPLGALKAQAVAHLGPLALDEYAKASAPQHVAILYDFVKFKWPDGYRCRRKQLIPWQTNNFTYDLIWKNNELILVGFNGGDGESRRVLPAQDGKPSSAQWKRFYVTRLSLPHMQYEHLHTIHLPGALASKIDAGVAHALTE